MQDIIRPKAIPFNEPKNNIGTSNGMSQFNFGPSRTTAKADMMRMDMAVWKSAAKVLPKSMFIGRIGEALIFLRVPFSLSKTIAPVATTMLENRSG